MDSVNNIILVLAITNMTVRVNEANDKGEEEEMVVKGEKEQQIGKMCNLKRIFFIGAMQL